MKLTEEQLYPICQKIAPKYDLEPQFVLAICQQEAGRKDDFFLCDVARLEQRFYTKYVENKDLATTTEVLLAASYGLGQLMGESLFELGYFSDDFYAQNEAYRATYQTWKHPNHFRDCIDRYCVNPEAQVETICLWFKRKLELSTVKGDIRKALLAWNGGSNIAYPDSVLSKYEANKKKY